MMSGQVSATTNLTTNRWQVYTCIHLTTRPGQVSATTDLATKSDRRLPVTYG